MKELAEWRREVYLGKPVDKSKFIWCPMGKPMFQEVSIPNVIYICIYIYLYIYIYVIYICVYIYIYNVIYIYIYIYIYGCAKYQERLPMFPGRLYLEIYKLCKSCYIKKSNRKKPPSDV